MSCCVPTDLWRKKALVLSKRGNIETELLLTNYVESLSRPTPQKRLLLEAFLNENDQALFNWLLKGEGSEIEMPGHYQSLIREIRDNYLNSNK